MTEVLVFSQHHSARLQYTLHWVLNHRLGLDLKITDAEPEFESYPGVKINYSNQTISNCLNIDPSSILFDTSINENFGEIGNWNGLKTFFKTDGYDIPFDIFGAIFYCLSRMEEYDNKAPDAHGRYKHNDSVLYKLDVLHTPIVDLWLEEFKNILLSYYPSIEFKKEEFKFRNTFDIDQAFCFSEKGFMRNAGGWAKDLLRFNLSHAMERILVVSGIKRDPYDTFEYIIQKHNDENLDTIVFLLLADYRAYHKNIDISNRKFIKRIKLLQERVILGIHPSYYSGNSIEIIRKEIKRLVDIQFKPVANSRQHYLKFTLPDTFRYLLDAGIRHEYSLGYAETIGFRAGTAHSFNWFDIERNEVTLLEIHPCCIMDVTLKNYLGLSIEQAKEAIKKIILEVKRVNGTFIPIWHNETISDFGEWKGWRSVYESMLSSKN